MNVKGRHWFHGVMAATLLLAVLAFVVWSRSSAVPAHGGLPDGSWVVSITPISGPPDVPLPESFLALMTMTSEGRVMESDLMPLALSPAATLGHGEWTRVSPTNFGLTYLKLLSDKNGNFQGVMKINETIKLDVSATKYSGTGVLDLLETDGSVRASFPITTQASLIGVELQKR